MDVLGFDHVQLAMPPGGEAQARWFWSEVVGLDEVAKPEPLAGRGGCWFRCGDHGLHCGTTGAHVAALKAHPAIRVCDVAALERLADRLEEVGVAVTWAAEPIAEARCKVHDPFGNLVEFLVGTTG